jgi:hypothetical protein
LQIWGFWTFGLLGFWDFEFWDFKVFLVFALWKHVKIPKLFSCTQFFSDKPQFFQLILNFLAIPKVF